MEKEKIAERIREIEAAMAAADFWSEPQRAQSLIKELQDLRAEAEGGSAYDRGGAIVSLVAGAGGDDAEDFARMLFEMYRKYFEKRGWSARILHENRNDHGGYRNMSMEVDGPSFAKASEGKQGPYGVLKNEYGVHRLVRISPFNASQKRHTSFVLVEVLPIVDKVAAVELDEKDLDITVARSSGPGGQNVNKRETAVRIVHTPTGLSTHVDGERTQGANKEKALAIIKAKLLRKLEEERKEKISDLSVAAGKIEWGNQIRSYVLHPYQLVKDHRTGVEVRDTEGVLNGNIEPFLEGQ